MAQRQGTTARTAASGMAGTAAEVFVTFLRLGLTSFGGQVAHLGYFRNALVERRRWIDEAGYGDLVALCQFLPGPASSQVGFALGLMRAGPLGGLAAWLGFTLPSALLMLAFAYGVAALDTRLGHATLHGLKLAAVAVVAQAVWGMARSLAPDRPRASIALGALALGVAPGGALGQIAAIALGALAGLALCRAGPPPAAGHLPLPLSRRVGALCLAAFALLLALALLPEAGLPALAAAFYRSGALVFGGGHVVLPLLQASVVAPGWVDPSDFLAGYGATQAVPGPLFSLAAFLGAVAGAPPLGPAGAALGLVALFLTGLLLVAGALPFWDALRRHPRIAAAMRGANAAVVGILGLALYDPVWTSAVARPADFVVAAAGFLLLTLWRLPPVVVVALAALAGCALV